MGYTHYFRQQRDLTDAEWEGLERHFLTAARALPKGVLAAWNEQPIRSPDECLVVENGSPAIAFNGNPGCESLVLTKNKQGHFEFCKTRGKPYDVMVCATLMLVHDRAPSAFQITSDGGPEEWEPARILLVETFHREFQFPF